MAYKYSPDCSELQRPCRCNFDKSIIATGSKPAQSRPQALRVSLLTYPLEPVHLFFSLYTDQSTDISGVSSRLRNPIVPSYIPNTEIHIRKHLRKMGTLDTEQSQGFDTKQVHAGQHVDLTTNARAVPIYASTSFVFNDAVHASELFALKADGYTYSRISNPTVEVFENRMAALEGGRAAVAAATGKSAQLMAIMALAGSGDNIVASTHMHGLAHELGVVLEPFKMSVKVVHTTDPADFASAIDTKTKAVYVESISNPEFVIHAIKDLAEVAHDAQVPLIVDNTLGMAGYLMRPIDYGADIVVESISKRIYGHGVALGGVVVDSGNFDWKQSDKFPGLTEHSSGHHSFVYADTFGSTAFAAKLRADILRDLGPSLEPFSAFFMLQGLETLSLRAERQCHNAYTLARWLEKHVKVSSVSYLGLGTHSSHVLAKSYLKKGLFGAVLTFALKGGATSVDIVMRNVTLLSPSDDLGDTRTLISRQTAVNGENVYAGSIRISAGIEASEDIIADLSIALDFVN
ncbi:hypothetical protein H2248_003941 [Termitomyces sp. 'cryptogamus']|nr:hypothetical protein H2248_003941 [Termitomyces sp. 'cryptogamus']